MNWASFTSVFLLGLMGSLHCVGMCGPLQSFLAQVPWQFKFLYHYGRYIAYVAIGILFCMTGYTLALLAVQKYFTIALGLCLILSVLFPSLFAKLSLPNPNARLFAAAKHQKASVKFFLMGFANGLLPCGLVYMAASQSMIGMSLWQTLLLMFLFFLGTLPALLGIRQLYQLLAQGPFFFTKLKPTLIICLGILMIFRGLNTQQQVGHQSHSQVCGRP